MDKNLELLLSKADTSRWAKPWMYDYLPFEDYYKPLILPSNHVKTLTGQVHKLETINKINIYKNVNNQYFAQVASFTKRINKHKNIPDRVTVATYLAHNEQIYIINHLDAVGRTHANDYSIYPEELQPIYQKYFTDEINTEPNGKIYPLSHCPHFHFNTASQTEKLNGQEKSNAISINQLIKYLKDLHKCKDPYNPILNNSLGMPFLAYLKQNNKYQYISNLYDITIKIKNLYSNSKNTKLYNYMCELEKIIEYKHSGDNIENIIFDLKILNKIIERFPNNLDLIAIFSNAFMKSLNNKTQLKELEVY